MGFGASGSANKSWQTQTQSGQQGPNEFTQNWLNQIYGAAQGAGGSVPQSVQGALDFLSGQSNGSQYMNPYQQQVIDANNAQWQRTNQQTMNAVNDAATRARAFGGSRAAIAQGTALAANNLAQQQQTAGLLQSGFQDATQRAMQAANLGMGAGSPDLWRLQVLRQSLLGLPYGTTSSGTQGTTGTSIGAKGGFSVGTYGG